MTAAGVTANGSAKGCDNEQVYRRTHQQCTTNSAPEALTDAPTDPSRANAVTDRWATKTFQVETMNVGAKTFETERSRSIW